MRVSPKSEYKSRRGNGGFFFFAERGGCEPRRREKAERKSANGLDAETTLLRTGRRASRDIMRGGHLMKNEIIMYHDKTIL